MASFLRIIVIITALHIIAAPALAMTVKDMAGRSVTLPNRIERIVAINAALRLIVYLGAFDRVVGIEANEKGSLRVAARPYGIVIQDRVPKLPPVGEGGPGRLPNYELLMAVKPQVVITANQDISHAELIQQKTGIPVVVVSYGDLGIFDQEKITESIQFLGRILENEPRARAIIGCLEDTLADLRKRTTGIAAGRKPSVYVGGVSFRGAHGITSTQAFYPPLEWIQAKNVANEAGKRGPLFIDLEKLLVWDPDFLFIDGGNLELVNHDYLKNRELINQLKSAKENKVFTTFPYNTYATNVEIALANAYFLGKTVYPGRFPDIDPLKKADEIFKFFVGSPVLEHMQREIKGFKGVELKREGLMVR